MPGDKRLIVPFEIKKDDVEETGIFRGYGSVFGNIDSHKDIVMPGAFNKSIHAGGRNGTGVAMLYQHDSHRPIGIWTELVEDSKGLRVEGKLAMNTQDGREVYELMKLGALKGLSIGYETVVYKTDDKKGLRYLEEVDLWEISPVTFGSNKKATIDKVKKIDIEKLKEAKTERELENLLREAEAFSVDGVKLLVKMCKSFLREAEKDDDEKGNEDKGNEILSCILDSLKNTNHLIEFKKVIPFKSYDKMPEETAWKAGEQVKAATVEDLKAMCTWYNDANPDVKGSYKLPHHIKDGYKTIWRGVAAAMARLLQSGTQIPAGDRKGCYTHLAKHYKEFEKEPPKFKDYSEEEWKECFSEFVIDIKMDEILEELKSIN